MRHREPAKKAGLKVVQARRGVGRWDLASDMSVLDLALTMHTPMPIWLSARGGLSSNFFFHWQGSSPVEWR
jgi:hypothetical protein